MDARSVQGFAAALTEARQDERQRLALSAVSFALALVTSVVYPSLAVPFLAGGLVLATLGIRAAWRQWDLLDRLAGDADAYVIPQVRAFAARDARMDRRRMYAALARARSRDAAAALEVVLDDELEDLARDLEDAGLELEPCSAVACRRLFTEPAASPLFDPRPSSTEVRASILRIRAGFHAGHGADAPAKQRRLRSTFTRPGRHRARPT